MQRERQRKQMMSSLHETGKSH